MRITADTPSLVSVTLSWQTFLPLLSSMTILSEVARVPRYSNHTTLRWRVARCAIAGALAIGWAGVALVDAGPASAVSPAPVCVGTDCTVTFSTPGVGQSWVVPTGVTSASFALYGAVGGSEGSIPGGDGAKITGTL